MNKISCNNLEKFKQTVNNVNPNEILEMGIYYQTEIKDKKGQTIKKEKEFPFDDKKELIKTYQKVISIKEADEKEKEQAKKGRSLFKELVQNVLEDKNKRQVLFLVLGLLSGYNVYQKNILPLLVCIASIITLKKMPLQRKSKREKEILNQEKRKEELHNLGLSSLLYDTDSKTDIGLYIKQMTKECLPVKDDKYMLQKLFFFLQKSQMQKDYNKQRACYYLIALQGYSMVLKRTAQYLEEASEKLIIIKRELEKSMQELHEKQVSLEERLQELRAAKESLQAVIRKRQARLELKPSLQM